MPKQLTHIHREGTKDNERLKRLQTNFRCSKNNKAFIFIYYVYAMRWLGLNLANVQTIEKTMVTKNNPKTSKGSLLLSFVHLIFLYGSMTHFYECCVAHVTRVRSVICVRICARFFCFVFFFNIFFHRVTGEVKRKFFVHHFTISSSSQHGDDECSHIYLLLSTNHIYFSFCCSSLSSLFACFSSFFARSVFRLDCRHTSNLFISSEFVNVFVHKVHAVCETLSVNNNEKKNASNNNKSKKTEETNNNNERM